MYSCSALGRFSGKLGQTQSSGGGRPYSLTGSGRAIPGVRQVCLPADFGCGGVQGVRGCSVGASET